jgi:hypothetical protein
VNILDENILESQRQLLRKWGVPFRQIGYEIGRMGMKDDEIIPFLLSLRNPTLFTIDRHFYKRTLCHTRYGLVYLNVGQSEAAIFVRRLLRHPEFDTQAKRMGTVIRASQQGLQCGVFTPRK